MKLHHIAIWTNKLEEMKDFYINLLNGKANNKYSNPVKGFESYFITFESGAKLELMSSIKLSETYKYYDSEFKGYTHMAFSVGNKEAVDELTESLRKKGYKIIGEPRTTGDGFYESSFMDPDGNKVEITE